MAPHKLLRGVFVRTMVQTDKQEEPAELCYASNMWSTFLNDGGFVIVQ